MNRGEPERYDVLLSHHAADAALAEAVRARLSESGLTSFSPFAGIDPDDYQSRLRPALDSARAYAVILSRSAIGSPYLLLEVGAAWAVDVPVLLLLSDVQPAEVSEFMEQYPSFLLWKDFPKLITAIRKLPERQPA